ncbi:SIR2 family protein [Methanosarcina sp. Mfa9]|uniref:SIR2 family protein n=1 Tax=Methanosarcina sp. Mfa9 TaxID=3439063 RepID=UPI003F842FE5
MKIISLDTPEAEPIISQLLQNPPVLLAGSGISGWDPTCLPMGKDFTKNMFDLLFPPHFLGSNPDLSESLNALWKNVPFENLLECCPNNQKLVLIIKRVFEIDISNPIHKIIADALIDGKFRGIVTPNYDICLDKLLPEEKGIKRIVTENDFQSIGSTIKKYYFKIHGSADDKEGETLVYSLSRESCLPNWKRNLLLDMIKGNSLLIVGYSGLDFEICPEILKMPVTNVLWNVREEIDTLEDIETKLSPNASLLSKEMQGYFLVGDMQTLFSSLTNHSIDLKWGKTSNDLLNSFKNEFTEFEIGIWRASLLNKIGCASLALKASEELLAMCPQKEIDLINIRKQKAQSLYHNGKYHQSAKEYYQIAEKSNSFPSLRVALLLDSCNAYRVYGGFFRSIFCLIKVKKEICKVTEPKAFKELNGKCALKEIFILRHLFQIAKTINVKFAKYSIQKKATNLLQIASKNSLETGNWFDFQQVRHWAERMDIDPLILEHDIPYGPPPIKEGYEHLASHVAQSMHFRDQLFGANRNLSVKEKFILKTHIEQSIKFGNCPEVWKLSYICLKKNASMNKKRTIQAVSKPF